MFTVLFKCCVLAWMTVCTLSQLVEKLLVMNSDFSCGLLFSELWWLSVYGKGTKQILVAVCVVEFAGLNFPVCKLQFYTVKFTGCSVNVFTVFLYFLPNHSGNHSCQNYFVKTMDFIDLLFFFSASVSKISAHFHFWVNYSFNGTEL